MFPGSQFQEKELSQKDYQVSSFIKKNKNIINLYFSIGYLSEYAFFLKPGGMIYCITDVEELHHWHEKHLSENKLFRRVEEKEIENDVCIKLIINETEEGKKVERNKGKKYFCVYKRI